MKIIIQMEGYVLVENRFTAYRMHVFIMDVETSLQIFTSSLTLILEYGSDSLYLSQKKAYKLYNFHPF